MPPTVLFRPSDSFDDFRDRPRANVLGVGIDAVDMEQALALIANLIGRNRIGYICAVGVHGILQALHSPEVARALADALIVLPDGAPTVWVGRMQGMAGINHVTGPAIMREMLRRSEFSGLSHFFYGGKPGIAEELAATVQRDFPWTRVAGTYTPPFRDLTKHEELEVASRMNALRPDVIWIGISTPRQDLLMRRLSVYLDNGLMFGVGAAFDFLTGHIRDCSPWVKRAGLQWLHRLAQEPRRLWRRNLGNTEFLWHIGLQITRLRAYPLQMVEPLFADTQADRNRTQSKIAG